MVQINVISNLIVRETASEWPDDGVWTCSMGNLTRISWETSLALVCGQLFAPPVKHSLWMHEYSDVIKFSKNGGFHRTLM